MLWNGSASSLLIQYNEEKVRCKQQIFHANAKERLLGTSSRLNGRRPSTSVPDFKQGDPFTT